MTAETNGPQPGSPPLPLHPWPNEISIAINLTEKLQKFVRDKDGEKLGRVDPILQLDEIYQAAPGLEQIVRDAIYGRHVPDEVYEFLDREESNVIGLVLENLPAEQVNSLKEAIRTRAAEEQMTNSA